MRLSELVIDVIGSVVNSEHLDLYLGKTDVIHFDAKSNEDIMKGVGCHVSNLSSYNLSQIFKGLYEWRNK